MKRGVADVGYLAVAQNDMVAAADGLADDIDVGIRGERHAEIDCQLVAGSKRTQESL